MGMPPKWSPAQVAVVSGATILVVLVLAWLCVATAGRWGAGTSVPTSVDPVRPWILVGTGMTAAACLYRTAPPIRSAIQAREASARFGGRVLSVPLPTYPVSTTTPAMELGAWSLDPFLHSNSMGLLHDLQIPTTVQLTNPAASFVFTGGRRTPWPASAPPLPTDYTQPYGSVGDPSAWIAATGIPPAAAPMAAAASVHALTLPTVCTLPAGLGWQAVEQVAFGLTPVAYGRQLARVSTIGASIQLEYSSGESETLSPQGAVMLTVPPGALLGIAGLLPAVKTVLQDGLTSVSQGVLYLTWLAKDVWWETTGFINGVAATDTILGRISVVGPTVLRCGMTGAVAVDTWSATLAAGEDGVTAAKTQAVSVLKAVFNAPGIPVPSFLSFRGWPSSLWLWNTTPHGTSPAVTQAALLQRPFGTSLPVYWASGDVSGTQGCVEGAISSGYAAAAILNQTPPPTTG